jgi:signal transduction histidine kinase
MERARSFGWFVVALAGAAMFYLVSLGVRWPPLGEFLFWVILLMSAELLPVSLGFQTQVTMSFPIALAAAITYRSQPAVAMAIAGLGAFDARELRHEIPIWHALFNRAQLMLAVGAAAGIVLALRGGAIGMALGALGYSLVNLFLVATLVTQLRGAPLRAVLEAMFPKPVGGFVTVQALLGGLGAATAAAYQEIGFFVAAFLIPLLFARLSILGARAQQELGERVRLQQRSLLDATERVFAERESERRRIAEDIHDSSLQMLAAAAYGCGNTQAFLDAGNTEEARGAVVAAQEAIDSAIKGLRESLVDLRRSSVEEGGLLTTISNYAQQLGTLWGVEVKIEGGVRREPPIPVALAAFQILQEGLVNALKHSEGGAVVVKMSDADNMVHIVVEDDGPGFDPGAEVGRGHVGMRLMRERAARVGGRIELDSQPGSGTRVEAILPGGVAS